mgnify:CR=1 FL=1
MTGVQTCALPISGRDFSASVTPRAGNPLGSVFFTTTAGAKVDYELMRNFILSTRFAFTDYAYVRDTRHTQDYTVGGTATYLFNRFFSGSLDYRHTTSHSTVAASNYRRNVVTASVKGQF